MKHDDASHLPRRAERGSIHTLPHTRPDRLDRAIREADACAEQLIQNPTLCRQIADHRAEEVAGQTTNRALEASGRIPSGLLYALRLAPAWTAVWFSACGRQVIAVTSRPGTGCVDPARELEAWRAVRTAVTAITEAPGMEAGPVPHFALPEQIAVLRWEVDGRVLRAVAPHLAAGRNGKRRRLLGVAALPAAVSTLIERAPLAPAVVPGTALVCVPLVCGSLITTVPYQTVLEPPTPKRIISDSRVGPAGWAEEREFRPGVGWRPRTLMPPAPEPREAGPRPEISVPPAPPAPCPDGPPSPAPSSPAPQPTPTPAPQPTPGPGETPPPQPKIDPPETPPGTPAGPGGSQQTPDPDASPTPDPTVA